MKQSFDVDEARTVTTVPFVGVAPDESIIKANVVHPFVPQNIDFEFPMYLRLIFVYVAGSAKLFPCVGTVPDVV